MPSILLPAQGDQIEKAMQFLEDFLQNESEAPIPFIELAMEELLLNVISYAYPNANALPGKENKVEVGGRRVKMDGYPFICIWIRDWGKPYDPFSDAPSPDLTLGVDERPIGGLGVHLVKNTSAHHFYSGEDGANTIELFFKVDG